MTSTIYDILHRTKISDYFYVITTYQGEREGKPIYHTVAHREVYIGSIGGVGDYAGSSIPEGEDIEEYHLKQCAYYRSKLQKGGAWEYNDRPLAEAYEFEKKRIAEAKKLQDELEKNELKHLVLESTV